MEEQKVIDPVQSQSSEDLEVVRWQWQSDPGQDPWKEQDPTKQIWRYYSENDCLIIEKAFSLNQKVAELKDYEIDLKNMLQVNKKSRNRVRRVRREQKPSRFMMGMPQPKIIKDQKTINEAFGTVQNFLDYIIKRTPEAYGLYQKLKTLTLSSKNTEFEDIVQQVIVCIKKGAEAREKNVQSRIGSQKTTGFISEAQNIVDFLSKKFANLRDFLKAILKVYTMESFICYWQNELLRCEDWEEINVLTPYLVCLVYTFKLPEFTVKYQLKTFMGLKLKQKLSLYRGTVLAKMHLALYDMEKVKYFSWNGVTSTSTEKAVALKFIKSSLSKTIGPKIEVLFKINSDFSLPEDCEGMIDISELSKYPQEKEIIFAPGTVFQLKKIRCLRDGTYKINLKVVKSFEKIKKEISLLGPLHDGATQENMATIKRLPSQESFRLLELLKGNKRIRKLRIQTSVIKDYIMEEIENMRMSTNVKKQDIELDNNRIIVSSIGLLAYYFSPERLSDILVCNEIQFQKGIIKNDQTENKDRAQTIVLKNKALEKLQHTNSWKEFWENMKNGSENRGLDLSDKEMQIPNDKFHDIIECVKESKFLKNLNLKLNQDEMNLESLWKAIGSSSTLRQLDLELISSDEEFSFFKKVPQPTIPLQHLSIGFSECRNISSNGLASLGSSLLFLKCLQHLSLNFSHCGKISDEGLDHLKTSLKELTSLQCLSLDFSQCANISDEGLKYLKDCLISLKSLECLYLSFLNCCKISNEGLNHLKSGLILVTSLKHLSLDFTNCNGTSDEEQNDLKGGLLLINSLKQKIQNFYFPKSFTDKGLDFLASGLLFLKCLQFLSLNFSQCSKISDEMLDHLKNGFKELTSLQHLSLDFSRCVDISNKGLNHLNQGLQSLKSLKKLSLKFGWCNNISDEGLNSLGCGLRTPRFLQSLSLNFRNCPEISDEGLNRLKNGFVSATSLKRLTLDFASCNKISHEGLNYLKRGFKRLEYLQELFLNVEDCKNIPHERRINLQNELEKLLSLKHLHVKQFATIFHYDPLNEIL